MIHNIHASCQEKANNAFADVFVGFIWIDKSNAYAFFGIFGCFCASVLGTLNIQTIHRKTE